MNICFQKNGFREIIYNSLQHKLYSTGIPIQISVYEDKIYIWNDGEFPKTITSENLYKKHASRPSNPKIAGVFFKAGFTESWGRGFEKIKEECDKYDTPLPEIIESNDGVMIKCNPSKIYLELLDNMKSDNIITNNFTIKSKTKLTNLQNEILTKLKRKPDMTQKDLSVELEISRQSIATNIKDLKERKILERVGSNKKGYWKIILQ